MIAPATFNIFAFILLTWTFCDVLSFHSFAHFRVIYIPWRVNCMYHFNSFHSFGFYNYMDRKLISTFQLRRHVFMQVCTAERHWQSNGYEHIIALWIILIIPLICISFRSYFLFWIRMRRRRRCQLFGKKSVIEITNENIINNKWGRIYLKSRRCINYNGIMKFSRGVHISNHSQILGYFLISLSHFSRSCSQFADCEYEMVS